MNIKIEDEKKFKISIDNSLGLMKIAYQSSHKNIIKVDEISNLFLYDNEIHISTEKHEFIYQFDPIKAKNVFTEIQNKYVNYYSVNINNKDYFKDKITIQEKKEKKDEI